MNSAETLGWLRPSTFAAATDATAAHVDLQSGRKLALAHFCHRYVSLFICSASGALWCKVVYPDPMSIAERPVRQSVSLPARVARRVKSLAQTSKTSTSRVMADLIESGLNAREQEKKRFFELADRLSRSRDPEEQKRLKEELARMTFGE